ncbi:MAG: YdcF family protein [Bacilli bacterium]
MPGGSYSELSERAAKLWINNYAPMILPSGKYSKARGMFLKPSSKADKYNDSYKTEWDFLRQVLLKNGVDEKAILREDKAENTYENAFKSREITDKLGLKINKAIVCCKSFHARRCFVYYQWAYPHAEIIICPCDVAGINKYSWFTSENGRDRVLNELTKSGEQFKSYIKDISQQHSQCEY